MTSLINNYNKIIDMKIFVENFNNIKMHKKLVKFDIVDIDCIQVDLPIFKPTLNVSEQILSTVNLECGQYVLIKLRKLSKIIVYRDLDGKFWEIVMKNDNTIIDIDPFKVNGYDGTNISINKNDKVSDMVDSLIKSIESINQNIPSSSNQTPTPTPNLTVFNCTKSSEYKMIIYAILNCTDKLPVCDQPYVKTDKLLESIKLFSKIINNNWKVLRIISNHLLSHVFITCDDKQQIWMIVTDWLFDNVIDVFPIEFTLN